MKNSIEISDEAIGQAITLLGHALKSRIAEKGRDSFVNAHEILGATEVEVAELKEAVHLKKNALIIEELIDVAVGCVFGVASIRANQAGEKNER